MKTDIISILQIDDYLKSFGKEFIYCGSMSLYLHGMYISEIHDIDVDFLGLDDNDKYYINLTSDAQPDYIKNLDVMFDKMFGNGFEDLREGNEYYEKVVFEGRTFLVSTLQYEIDARKRIIANLVKTREEKGPSELIFNSLQKLRNRITQIQNFLKKKKNR